MMNIKLNPRLFLIGPIILLTGCSAADPPPYLFDPNPFPSLEEQAIFKAKRREKIDSYLLEHPELTKHQRVLIDCGLVGDGLLKEHVLFLKGVPPDKIEKKDLKYDADEMWFYRGVNWNDYYYFKDGVLIKIDDKR